MRKVFNLKNMLLLAFLAAAALVVRAQAWPEFFSRSRHFFKILLLILTVGEIFRWEWRKRALSAKKGDFASHLLTLSILGLFSLLAYVNLLTFHGGWGVIHGHDLTHYYLGAKYFPELGYFKLYEAMVLAEEEGGGEWDAKDKIRDLRTNIIHPISRWGPRIEKAKLSFCSRRWEAFREDYRFFRSLSGIEGIKKFITDHGYNPPPTWTAFGNILANYFPLRSRMSLALLVSLDFFLLAGALAMVFAVFKARTGWLFLIFFANNCLSSYDFIGGGFLRQDWFFATIAAVCLFYRGRPAFSGGLIAYATMVRLFPGLILLPVLFRSLAGEVKNARWPAELIKFAIAFTAVAGLLFLISLPRTGGIVAWQEFYRNIRLLSQWDEPNGLGLRSLYILSPYESYQAFQESGVPGADVAWRFVLAQNYRKTKNLLHLSQLLLLVLLLTISVRSDRKVALSLGSFFPFIFLYIASYYHSILAVLVVGFEKRAAH